MVGVLVVVLGASPFIAVDGGSLARSQLPVPHRTIEVFAPSDALQPILISDGDAPRTQLRISIEGAPAPRLDAAGALFYGDALLTVAEPLTLRIKRSDSLTIMLAEPFSRRDGAKHFIDRPNASFALIPSAPFEDLGAGRLRVVGPTASIEVQLQVSGPPIAWPVTNGPQSWGASVVWDAARGRFVRFGGSDAFGLEAGTFIWDPVSGWQVLPIASPPPRARASLVYDSVRQRVVLFGGLKGGGVWLGDTWEFDGSQWVELTPATSPPARWSHGAAFDETAGAMILFGGVAGPSQSLNELGDTWRWDGTSWTQLRPPNSPSARDAFGMTWDGTRRRVTLVAGWDGQNVLSDAWAWTGTDWQQLPSLPAAGRSSTALAWSPVSGDLVLAGGWVVPAVDVASYFAETWRFNGTWRRGPNLPRAGARMALAGHPTLGVVMLGGRDDRVYSADFAMLEPVWQRLTQGDRPERGPVLDSHFVFVGERYLWRREVDSWFAANRMPVGVRIAAVTGSTLFVVVADGGVQAWRSPEFFALPVPPPFQIVGESNTNHPWVLDFDGGLHVNQFQQWEFVGTVPVPVRALTQRSSFEYLAWADGLAIWTPADGGLRSFGDPLSINGGLVLSPTTFTAIATEARGSWHLSNAGRWVYVSLPTLAERAGSIVVTDGGLASYDYLKPPGARCESTDECALGSCSSGRCCDRPCVESCEVCSDGVCRTAPYGLVCLETGCGIATCDGVRATCPALAPCVDAGTEPMVPPRDAGLARRDAGGQPVEPEAPPPGCGCVGSPGTVWGLAFWLLGLRRRAPRRVSSRTPPQL